MNIEELEARLKQLEEQKTTPTKKFTDSLKLPEDIDADSLKEILEKFEDHLQTQFGQVVEKTKKESDSVRKEQERRQFDQEVAEFRKAHADLFEANNEVYLDILNTLFHKESSKGVPTKDALAKAYENLTKTTSYKSPSEKKEETPPPPPKKEESPFGTVHPEDTSKVKPGEIEKTAPKDIREAAKQTLDQMENEGLTFPSL